MGAIFSATELFLAGDYEMKGLPARRAKEVFVDVRSLPSFVPEVKKVQLVRGKPSTEGFCWLEYRDWEGTALVLRSAITELKSKESHSFCRIVTTVDSKITCAAPKLIQTFTVTIEPKQQPGEPDDKEGCLVKWTMGFVPVGIKSTMLLKMTCNSFSRAMKRNILYEVRLMYEEGLRRHQAGEGSETSDEQRSTCNEKVSFPRRSVPDYLGTRQ